MTISKYIIGFLTNYENIIIETNHVADGSDKYGMFKSPSRDKVMHNDGSMTITEYFTFFAKQSAISESERKDSDVWLEDFIYWIDDFKLIYEYPEIDGNRIVTDISATGSPNPMFDDNDDITYSITLSITYEREAL